MTGIPMCECSPTCFCNAGECDEADCNPSPPCPATGGGHDWTDDAGEITARYGVSVYCSECKALHPNPQKGPQP